MPRYRLLIEYDGRPYHGFQAQDDLASVQGSIERAVKAFCGQTLRLQAAGRTDAGVHATGQVIHLDLEKTWRPDVVRDALNAHLVPEPICVVAAAIAPEGWHARFSARERRYLYRILNRKSPPALTRAASGTSRSRWTPRPWPPPRPCSSATTISPPSATWAARRSRR